MLTFVLLVLALWMRMTLQKVKWTMGSKYPHTCIEEPASQTDGIERKNKNQSWAFVVILRMRTNKATITAQKLLIRPKRL